MTPTTDPPSPPPTSSPVRATTATRPSRPQRPPLLTAGLVMLGVLVVVAVVGPVLAPHDPKALSGDAVESPSASHLLGTNDIGQDILSELLVGTRSSLMTAFGAASLALAVGASVGIGAGLRDGWVANATMRVVDGALAFPGFPLVVLLAALAPPSRVAVVLVIALAGWPALARILHSRTLQLRRRGFVRAARGFGAPLGYVMRRHVFPALGPTAAAGFVHWAAVAVVLESGLAFLGLADPTWVSWGSILLRAHDYQGLYYSSLWVWWVLPAGLAITVTALSLTFVAVGLEPNLNPQLQTSL